MVTAETSGFVSIYRFAEMFDISDKTAMKWIAEHEVFQGRTKRQNRTLFVARAAIDEWERMFGRATDLITTARAAWILGVSIQTVWRRVKSDPEFPRRRRVKGIMRFSRQEIEEYGEKISLENE